MSIDKEEAFIQFWEANREKQKKSKTPYLIGFSSGLGISLLIMLLLSSGWYSRADMVANSKLNPLLLLIATTALSVFMAYLYRNYKWEQLNNQYLEFVAKKKKKQIQQDMQQDELKNSH